MTAPRFLSRVALTGAAAAVTVIITAVPAAAHIDVKADKAQAGATDVTVSFSAESESKTAGIISLQVLLPPGIAPADVTLASGPTGWTLTPAADGYTVAGPALPGGEDAKYAVKIAKLPADATELPFKTIQTYAGGKVDRWIEVGGTPSKPAPVLKVAAAAPGAQPTTTTVPPTTTTTTSTAPPTSATNTAAPAEDSGTPAWVWILIAAAIVIALVGGGLLLRRRRTSAE